MASIPEPGSSIFAQLNERIDPKLQEEKAKAAQVREQRQYETAQGRLADLLANNSTLACTINQIRVLGAPNTRRSFIERVFQPLLGANRDRPYTLAEAIREVQIGADKLHGFDIFHEPINLFVEKPDQSDPLTSPTDLDFYLAVKEKGWISAQSGTTIGNAEGGAYGNVLLRNLFGGAESLNLNVSAGTRERLAYRGAFETPVLSNPRLWWQIGGLASTTQKSWASHEEATKSGWTSLRWITSGGHRHEFQYTGSWRQLTGLASDASPTIRGEAGDSVKSSISHTWVSDGRNHPMLPSRGFYTKTLSEIAGWGPLQGDVAFWKTQVETQAAAPVPIPGTENIVFTAGLRAGILCPLGLGSDPYPRRSRISDRFQLGGPTDVRGFRMAGLGPRDGPDAVGGDIYAAGSANLLFPVPRVRADRPFRMQLFVNGGRLLALRGSEKEDDMHGKTIRRDVYSTIRELGNGLPSMAAGIGLVYAHPAARFELNFSLPLVLRRGEEGRKGLQFGVGINLL